MKNVIAASAFWILLFVLATATLHLLGAVIVLGVVAYRGILLTPKSRRNVRTGKFARSK